MINTINQFLTETEKLGKLWYADKYRFANCKVTATTDSEYKFQYEATIFTKDGITVSSFVAKRRFATSADEAIEDLKEHYNRLNTPIGVSQDIKR